MVEGGPHGGACPPQRTRRRTSVRNARSRGFTIPRIPWMAVLLALWVLEVVLMVPKKVKSVKLRGVDSCGWESSMSFGGWVISVGRFLNFLF